MVLSFALLWLLNVSMGITIKLSFERKGTFKKICKIMGKEKGFLNVLWCRKRNKEYGKISYQSWRSKWK